MDDKQKLIFDSENEKENEEIKEKTEEIEEKEKIEIKTVKKKRKKWPIIITLIFFLAVIGGFYFYGYTYYKTHFFPNTVINTVLCSNQMDTKVISELKNRYDNAYDLKLIGKNGNVILTIYAKDIDMVFSIEDGIEDVLQKQNIVMWPKYFLGKEPITYDVPYSVSYNENALQAFLKQNEALFQGTADIQPQDAYIDEYNQDTNSFEIIEAKEGDYLNYDVTLSKLKEVLDAYEDELLLEESKCYEQPKITSFDESLKKEYEILNKMVQSNITYDWNGNTVVVDGSIIKDWIIWNENEILLDADKIRDFVTDNARAYDTYGKNRTFTTTDGLKVVLPSGDYGWKTDRKKEAEALYEDIINGKTEEKEPAYKCRGWVKGKDDIGNSYVEINITAQHLYVYDNGEIIIESDFVSGDVAKGNSTPAGVFGITYKKEDVILHGADYESHVLYWMPFNRNIGMHDASWRRKFGGQIYQTNGSHGCVNLPKKKAKLIYEFVEKGFPVVVYYVEEQATPEENTSVTP